MMLSTRWGPVATTLLLLAPIILGVRLLASRESLVGWGGATADQNDRQAASGSAPIDSLVREVRGRGPFRPDGRPSARVYDPARSVDQSVEYAPPKPALVLSGVLDGRTPTAILEGVPGRDGSVILGVGDTAGGLRVRQIREGRVTIIGMDTTWVLTLRRGL